MQLLNVEVSKRSYSASLGYLAFWLGGFHPPRTPSPQLARSMEQSDLEGGGPLRGRSPLSKKQDNLARTLLTHIWEPHVVCWE